MVSTELYPFQGRYYDLDGLNYHYLDEGSGDPVVMVHGNPTWSFYYRDLVRSLSGQFRAIVPDHIGCGLSDKPGDDQYNYTLGRRADDLERLLDHLGICENITLVLHDWGGMIGSVFATRHPNRICRLVILNTSAFHLPPGKRFPLPLMLSRSILGAFLIRGFNAFSRTATRVCCTRVRLSPEVRRAYTEPYDSWKNLIATLRFVQDIPLKTGEPAYGLVSQVEENICKLADRPTLICWGMKDFVFDAHFLELWEAKFPNAEVHRFEDCGHYVLEDAREEIAALVQDFLIRHPIAKEIGI